MRAECVRQQGRAAAPRPPQPRPRARRRGSRRAAAGHRRAGARGRPRAAGPRRAAVSPGARGRPAQLFQPVQLRARARTPWLRHGLKLLDHIGISAIAGRGCVRIVGGARVGGECTTPSRCSRVQANPAHTPAHGIAFTCTGTRARANQQLPVACARAPDEVRDGPASCGRRPVAHARRGRGLVSHASDNEDARPNGHDLRLVGRGAVWGAFGALLGRWDWDGGVRMAPAGATFW